MNREDVIRMTKEAMQSDPLIIGGTYFTLEVSDIERLIAAAKAEEREAIKQIAEKELFNTSALMSLPQKSSAAWNILQSISARKDNT